jgi:hypothetical protein
MGDYPIFWRRRTVGPRPLIEQSMKYYTEVIVSKGGTELRLVAIKTQPIRSPSTTARSVAPTALPERPSPSLKR